MSVKNFVKVRDKNYYSTHGYSSKRSARKSAERLRAQGNNAVVRKQTNGQYVVYGRKKK